MSRGMLGLWQPDRGCRRVLELQSWVEWRMLMEELDRLIASAGFADHRWTDGSKIAVARWVRMKCTYTCDAYARQACCPPNVPSVDECADFFADYERIAVIHIQKAGDTDAAMREWKKEVNASLLQLERAVFLAGYHKAMVLFPGDCSLCPECVARLEDCRFPDSSRPTLEALAVDVFATARGLGYPIKVLTDRSQTMDRYAVLLVE
jgi:predicted metal-binding protein